LLSGKRTFALWKKNIFFFRAKSVLKEIKIQENSNSMSSLFEKF
jgi:hypothetical protein